MTPKTTPKDFFVYLGATIALYAGAIALVNLFFAVIDSALPDALSPYFTPSAIAWPLSILLVLIPLLYVLEWAAKRDMKLMPEKAELWVRRWRIFLTLFLAGAFIAGDLIAVINTYLGGEITARFVWKALVVVVVAGVIFAYYLLERFSDVAPRVR
ncbi:MAG: hypothetical protein G01um101472_400, partial [Parcubacteria group bacterium Gr01-1014_72]